MIPISRTVMGNTMKHFCYNSARFGKYNLVTPGKVSEPLSIPEFISKPSYYLTGEPDNIYEIDIKDPEQLLKMKKSCKLAANILKVVGQQIRIGQTTDDIDKLVHKLALENNAYPSPFNYKHFPKSVCTSVNNVACHGIPDDRPLQDGDIINVDITVFFEGYHGDCSKTYIVGNVDEIGVNLVNFTEGCLNTAIDICKPGRRFSELGGFISRNACSKGYTVIPAFIGHGLGTYFHGPPDIYHSDDCQHRFEDDGNLHNLSVSHTVIRINRLFDPTVPIEVIPDGEGMVPNDVQVLEEVPNIVEIDEEDAALEPLVEMFANRYPGVMEKGMTFTIEPVIGQGSEVIEILEDGWTAVTIDGSRTAQFEHTICITNDGAEILTIPD